MSLCNITLKSVNGLIPKVKVETQMCHKKIR